MTLREHLRENSLTIAGFAELAGLPTETVRGWLYEGKVPRPSAMHLVMRVTGGAVTPNDWIGVETKTTAAA